MSEIFDLADYITLNISSPNTERLRELHNETNLELFLNKIKRKDEYLTKKNHKRVPLILKVSPDRTEELKSSSRWSLMAKGSVL